MSDNDTSERIKDLVEKASRAMELKTQYVVTSLDSSSLQVHPIRRLQLFEDEASGTSIAERLDIRFPRRTSTYYSVTKAEIDSYAQFDWLSSLLLTFFGTSSGFALGCIAALAQGTIPVASQTTLIWLAGTTGFISLILLAFAITLKVLQNRSKRNWESEDIA